MNMEQMVKDNLIHPKRYAEVEGICNEFIIPITTFSCNIQKEDEDEAVLRIYYGQRHAGELRIAHRVPQIRRALL